MAAELPEIYLRQDVGASAADELVRAGAWSRVRRGAYTDTLTGERWEQDWNRALAAALAAQRQLKNATLADDSAAMAHDLEVWQIPSATSVIQEYNPRSGLPADVRRRVCALDHDDVVQVGSADVTSLERTVVDCARIMHPRDALVIADSGMRAIVKPDREERRVDVAARTEPLRTDLLARIVPGSRGARRARAIITAADPLAENAAESVVRWIAIGRGMPRPVLQKEVVTSRGSVFTDLAWRFQLNGKVLWLHVEFDGTGKYLKNPRGRSTAQVLLDERKRESAITDTGDVVVRVYWDEITSENWVFTKITQRIARAVVNRYQRVPLLYRPPGR